MLLNKLAPHLHWTFSKLRRHDRHRNKKELIIGKRKEMDYIKEA